MLKTLTKTTVGLTFILILAACGVKNPLQSQNKCSSDEAQKLLKNIIMDEAEKGIKNKNDIDLTKARASFSLINLTADNIRTTKEDPNSTKVFCTATIKLSVPTEMFTTIEQAFSLANSDSNITQYANKLGFNTNANVFSKDFDYNTQPTDDGKKLYVELENAKFLSSFVGELVSIEQAKGKLEAKAAENAAQEQANREASIATAKAEYDAALRANVSARHELNLAWNALPKETQTELLEDQRAWVAQKKAQCGVAIDKAKIDFSNDAQLTKEVARLTCDTNMSNSRQLGQLD